MHRSPTSGIDTRCQRGLPQIGGRTGKPRRNGKFISNATQRQPHQFIYEELQNAASAAQNVNQSQDRNTLNLPLSTAGYSRFPSQTGPFSHVGGSSISKELPINSSENPGFTSSYCASQLAVQSNGPSQATHIRARTSPQGVWNPNNRSQLWRSGSPARVYDPSSGAESAHIQNQTPKAGQLRMFSSSEHTTPLTDPVPNCAAPPTSSKLGAVMDRCVRIEDKLDLVIRLLSKSLARGSLPIPGSEIPTIAGDGRSVLTNAEIENDCLQAMPVHRLSQIPIKAWTLKLCAKFGTQEAFFANSERETGYASKSTVGDYVQRLFSGRGAFKTDQLEWV